MKKQIPRYMIIDLLCTKHVHFTYGGKNSIQIDGVAMASSLDQLLANTFMISLQVAILPSIKKHIAHWKRYEVEI